jgi:hypothetical protein
MKNKYFNKQSFLRLFLSLLLVFSINCQAEEDMAKKLANPISSLISLPIQANFDENFGKNDNGSVWRINVQPVIPVSISDDWNMLSRTILPVIDQTDVPFTGKEQGGIGDISQSLFFSPKKPTSNGIIWGVGPVFLFDSASKDVLGTEKWGMGPTGVILKQQGPWTYGFLGNHIQSFAGNHDRADISATFMQPFLAYITSTKTTIGLNTESTYDWESRQWSVPINFTVMQLLKLGDHIIQVGGGVRYWADAPAGAAEDWGFRMQLTFLFPK